MARRKNTEEKTEQLENVNATSPNDDLTKNDNSDGAQEYANQEHQPPISRQKAISGHVTVISGNTVAIYQEPRRRAYVSGFFPHGAVALQKQELTDSQGRKWAEIECDGVSGWVEHKYLRGV